MASQGAFSHARAGTHEVVQIRGAARGHFGPKPAPGRSGQKQRRCQGSFWPEAGAWPKWSRSEALPGGLSGPKPAHAPWSTWEAWRSRRLHRSTRPLVACCKKALVKQHWAARTEGPSVARVYSLSDERRGRCVHVAPNRIATLRNTVASSDRLGVFTAEATVLATVPATVLATVPVTLRACQV